jgi:hypothetical protein
MVVISSKNEVISNNTESINAPNNLNVEEIETEQQKN